MKCKFEMAWTECERAGIPELNDFCLEHSAKKCIVCGEHANQECDHASQFVCGYPLCENCEGYVDMSKPSGAWGLLNHSHRKKNDEKV